MFKTQQHDRNNAAPRLLVVSKRKEDQVAQDAANRQAVVMALKQQHEARPPTDATALDNNESTQKPLSPSTAAALTTILDCDSLAHLMKFDPSNADEKAKITSIDIAGKGFTDARPDLLMGFMGVKELNANENHLELHQLANLTGLEVLTLACNALRQLQSLHDYDFPFLRVLDLSFNRLGNTALASLAALQRLEVLDLMSNEITAVPLDSICINRDKSKIGFRQLQVLSLEGNRLKSSAETMKALGKLPALRVLNMDNNQLSSFSMFPLQRNRPNKMGDSNNNGMEYFLNLEELHVANNSLNEQSDLTGAYSFPNLKRLWIRGNPMMKSRQCQSRKQAEMIIDMKELHGITVCDVSIPEVFSPTEKIIVAQRFKRLQANKRRLLQTEEDQSIDNPAQSGQNTSTGRAVKFLLPPDERIPVSVGMKGKSADQALRDKGIILSTDSNNTQLPPVPQYRQLFRNVTEIERAVWRVIGMEGEKEQQADNNSPTAADAAEDKTFMTSVNIQERPSDKIIEQTMKKRMSVEQLFDLDRDAYDTPLPSTIQESVKALRVALTNPSQYWRLVSQFEHEMQVNNGTNSTNDVNDGSQEQQQPMDQGQWYKNSQGKARLSIEDIRMALRNVDSTIEKVESGLDAILYEPSAFDRQQLMGRLHGRNSAINRAAQMESVLNEVQRQYEALQRNMQKLQMENGDSST